MIEKIKEIEYKIILGNCLDKLKDLEDNSIDSIVTDPPYGISFMGKKWDYDVPSVDVWKECFRVLKPGGHILSFSSARTYHRMAVNIEDAGFEIRDQIMWVYGSGFPKSHNVGKAIDKKLGVEREVVGINPNHRNSDALFELGFQGGKSDGVMTKGSSEYEGWGTALKPAHEPIVLARKPFKGTVVDNVLEHGTGAINIDGCRVEVLDDISNLKPYGSMPENKTDNKGFHRPWMENKELILEKQNKAIQNMQELGRWPANFIHDGSEEWSKYFYCPKANKKDRNEGCEDLEEKQYSSDGRNVVADFPKMRMSNLANNNHPTVKPTELMRYLCRLVTPKNGTVLDPFMGSGSTGKAAVLEDFNFTGIELSEEYLNIAEKRINNAITKKE